MRDEIKKTLFDIAEAAEEILSFVQGMDLKAYQASLVTQRAVERDFEIIGEALNRIRKIDEGVLRRIDESHRIIGFRNILIHGYDIVDETIVWSAAHDHVPNLIRQVRDILDGF